MDEETRLLWEASKVWAPDFPRRASTAHSIQEPVKNRGELVTSLQEAGEGNNPGYVSTYSFPRGHTDEGNLPNINSIFIDFDIPADRTYRETGNLEDWKRDMSALLVRSKMVARALIDANIGKYWRWSLSGHKGLHGFLDFPTLSPDEGSFRQFKNGLAAYSEGLVEQLNDVSGGVDIEPWLDVDSSDLARLVRHPNTRHHGVNHVASNRWCVPISTRELASLDDPNDYLTLTSGPRAIPESCERNPSENAEQTVAQYVRNASGSMTARKNSTVYSRAAVENYKEESNEKIEVEDIPLLTANKPCIASEKEGITSFKDREDAFDHGSASRTMEIGVIKELMNKNVPVDVIIEFFEDIPGFDEGYTRNLVEDVIGRQYGPLKCENIIRNAETFCLGSSCNLYDEAKHDVEDADGTTPAAVTN